MAIQTFTRLYDDHDDAVHIVQTLEQAGVPHADVSLVSNNADARHGKDGTSGTGLTSGNAEQGASTGGGTDVTLGTVLGGGAGLVGSLTGAGVSEADAHTYSEGVRRGGSLVTVRADDTMASKVNTMLDGRTPVDPAVRRTEYEKTGWTKFDPAAPAYTADQVTTARRSRVRIS